MERYSRLLELDNISEEKLISLNKKRVLIVGAGGVGQHVSTYLVTNGVTNISIIDFDKVELSNLNRQILLTESDVGNLKVEVVKRALLSRNSEAKIKAINIKVTKDNIDELVQGYDLVIDAVDNWETRLVISKACKTYKIPFLHMGVDGFKGQCCLFINKSLDDIVNQDITSYSRDGVLGPMVGMIASFGSLTAIMYLLGEQVEPDTLYYFEYPSARTVKMAI